ncbi:MAG TPA: pitrilysin family protein [Candidatus Limnocylindria bacterium]|nr:pitrilysin family protein [Candidatus Limnocylindria bacterium]
MPSADPVYRLDTLPGGLRIATAAMPHMASVSLGIWVGVGGRFEPLPLNGVSHFIEHMLFKGTRQRNAREISEAVEGIGGYLNAFTSEENTCFFTRAHHERLEETLDVLADMFLNSVFDPREIKKEREVIKEELAMYLDQPAQHVQELLNTAVWPDQPLGRPLTGSNESLDYLKRQHFIDYMDSHYVEGSTVVAAAGNVRHETLVELVKKRFRRLRKGTQPDFSPAVEKQTRPAVHLHTKNAEQTQIALGVRTCSRHDPRRHALRLLNAVLGENMSSRLFQSLREDKGLAYNIGTSLSFWADVGDLVVSAGVDTSKLEPAVRSTIKEFKRLIAEPVGKAEFQRTRDYVIGQMDLTLESTENHMMHVGEQILGYGSLTSPQQIRDRLAKVTPSEMRNAARDFLRPDRMTLALVSPRKKAHGLVELLDK